MLKKYLSGEKFAIIWLIIFPLYVAVVAFLSSDLIISYMNTKNPDSNTFVYVYLLISWLFGAYSLMGYSSEKGYYKRVRQWFVTPLVSFYFLMVLALFINSPEKVDLARVTALLILSAFFASMFGAWSRHKITTV